MTKPATHWLNSRSLFRRIAPYLFLFLISAYGIYLVELMVWAGDYYFPGLCLFPQTKRGPAVQCLRGQQVDVMPYFLTSFFYGGRPGLQSRGSEIFPLSGIAHQKTLLCNEGKGWEFFDSDRNGFSNSDGVWEGGAPDVVLLGDSFVLGECQPYWRRASTLIQERIPRMVNLGYSASGILSEYARLVEYGVPLRPKTIMWFYYEGNDPEETLLEYQIPILRRYLEEVGYSQGLLHRTPEISQVTRVALNEILRRRALPNEDPGLGDWAFLRLAHLQGLIQSALFPFPSRSPSANSYGWDAGVADPAMEDFLPLLDRVLGRVKKMAERLSARVIFVSLPDRWFQGRRAADRVAEAITRRGFELISMRAIFAAQGMTPYQNLHYSGEANRVLASEIVRQLGRRPENGGWQRASEEYGYDQSPSDGR